MEVIRIFIHLSSAEAGARRRRDCVHKQLTSLRSTREQDSTQLDIALLDRVCSASLSTHREEVRCSPSPFRSELLDD